MKQAMNDLEREVLHKLNDYFGFGLTPEQLETRAGIKKILDSAWKESKENLHNLGIAKFRIAKMHLHLLDKGKYVFGFIPVKRRDVSYHFDWVCG